MSRRKKPTHGVLCGSPEEPCSCDYSPYEDQINDQFEDFMQTPAKVDPWSYDETFGNYGASSGGGVYPAVCRGASMESEAD